MSCSVLNSSVFSDLRFLIKMRADCIRGLALLSLALTEKNIGLLGSKLNKMHEGLHLHNLIADSYSAIISGNASSVQVVSDELENCIENVTQIFIEIKKFVEIVSYTVDINNLEAKTIEQRCAFAQDSIIRKVSDVVAAIRIEKVEQFRYKLLDIESGICTDNFIKSGSDAQIYFQALHNIDIMLKELEIEVYKM